MNDEPPLRVALLDSIPDWGGGQHWDLQTARALGARGHFVAVACARGSALERRATALELPTWSAPVGRLGWRLGSAFSLAATLRRLRIDLVVANVGRDVRLGALAGRLAGTALLQRRGLMRPVRGGPWNRFLLERVVRRVLVNSPALEASLLASAPYLAGRVVLLPNGVALDEPDVEGAARLRRELGIPPDAPLVAAAGRLAPMKGFAHLIDAWPEVIAKQPDARLVLFGDGEERAALRDRAERLSVTASVHLAGFRTDTGALLAAADTFVLPSVRDESMSHAALEAMAAGLPVISSTVAHSGFETAGDACCVVPTGDSTAIGAAVVALLADRERRTRMGRAARAWVEAEHGLEGVTDRLEAVLREVRREHRARR